MPLSGLPEQHANPKPAAPHLDWHSRSVSDAAVDTYKGLPYEHLVGLSSWSQRTSATRAIHDRPPRGRRSGDDDARRSLGSPAAVAPEGRAQSMATMLSPTTRTGSALGVLGPTEGPAGRTVRRFRWLPGTRGLFAGCCVLDEFEVGRGGVARVEEIDA
jgi:hypothetical protein